MLRDRFPNGNVPAPNKPQPFLGVVTSAPDPTVSAQLGLAGGLGLVVEDLLPESPAAKGGVQPHDILKQINDQLLFNPSQLASLVQHYGKDAEVSVVVLRKGQEQKLTVKIGERVMPERRGFNGDFFGGAMSRLPRFDNLRRPMGEPNRDSENPPRDPGGRSRGPDEQPREGRPDPRGARGESADILREVGPNGAPEIRRSQDQTSTTWNTASARVMLKDEAGEMEVRSDDGKRVLTAKNAKGEVVFNGPIDTEEQRKGIPEEFRKKLEQIDIHSRAERRPPSQFQPRRGEEAPSPRDPGSSPRPPREREVQ